MIFGTTVTLTAIIMSFILLILVDLLIVILMKEQALMGLFFVDFFGCLLFVAIEWLPMFVGTIMALVIALEGAQVGRDRMAK